MQRVFLKLKKKERPTADVTSIKDVYLVINYISNLNFYQKVKCLKKVKSPSF